MQFDPTLSLSVLLSTVVTIAGFVITRFISQKEAESAEKQRNKELKNTHEQIKALQEQADALKLQVTLAAKREAIPDGPSRTLMEVLMPFAISTHIEQNR